LDKANELFTNPLKLSNYDRKIKQGFRKITSWT